VEEKLAVALFLCAETPNDLLEACRPEWNAQAGLSPKGKLKVLQSEGEEEKIFPFNSLLSREIETGPFNLSFLEQPLVYLRLRPGKGQNVKERFLKEGVAFTEIADNCIAVSSSTKVDDFIAINADAVVQDRSSQQVLEVLDAEKLKGKIKVWDCCAASGGKSILVWDTFAKVQLMVTDLRQSILHNLRSRFAQAGLTAYRAQVADLTKAAPFDEKFDLLVCDAPCSGAGTWGRTPEQLHFFTKEKLEHYTSLQKSIALNAARNVKSGGQFLYITCSVFEAENEDVVSYIQNNTKLQLDKASYFKGYGQKRDTLFAAAFSAL
jgi:16S rRNA (cytosine967-C5)-methyltransferase